MHGSLPLSFCASMFDCVFSTVIYAVFPATSLTPSSTIIFPLCGKVHGKNLESRIYSLLHPRQGQHEVIYGELF